MSTNLYEILEIQPDATHEQIRKAYKKRALQTHPDRAPAANKAQAEESFRQLNNAYEVLIDPQKRQSYDRHGIWPPPTEHPPRHTQTNARSHPLHSGIFTFTDPFELFNSIFGHENPFHDPFPFGRFRTFPDPFFAPPGFSFPLDPFRPLRPFNPGIGMGTGPFDMFAHDPFMMHPPMIDGAFFQPQGAGNEGRSASYFSSAPSPFSNRQGAGGGQWISESRSTSTINGLTTSVHERVDSLGNVHTTTTHPDGRETHTINGIPQASWQIDPPTASYPHRPNPTELPHRHRYHHRHRDHSRGRYNHHSAHRAYDRDDYSPDYRDSRRPRA